MFNVLALKKRPAIFYGWTIVGASAGLNFCQTTFFNTTLGVFLKPLSADFGWNRATVSGAISIGTLAGGALGFFIGPLVDRYGGRLFATAATASMALLLFGLATVQNLAMFYLFFAAGRALTNSNQIVSNVAISNWFEKRRGRAMGISALGNRIGVGLTPPLITFIIATSDWRMAYIALGVLVAIVGIIPSWRFFRARRPEDVGLLPDGEPAATESPELGRAAVQEAVASGALDSSWTLRQAMGTRAFWILMLSSSSIWIATGAINLHQIPHLSDRGIPDTAAAGVLSVIAFMGFLGSPGIGLIQERIGSRWAMMSLTFGLAIAMVFLINVHGLFMAYLYGVTYGIAFSGLNVISQLIFAEYFGRRFLGSILGSLAPVQTGLGALSPIVAGIVYDVSGSYVLFFSAVAVSFTLGAVLMFFAPPPKRAQPLEVAA